MTDTDKGAYLKVRNVLKKFGEFTALHDISLDVAEGEFVCFLGPSGCGKTTLLRAIAGLDIQTAGTVEQAGRDISALPPNERDFGIVFQSYALFPNLTVKKNIAYGLENRKMARAAIDTRVFELLDLVGLKDHANKYPAQLSGGQQQRVAIARAIINQPSLLLADEPTGALDSRTTDDVLNLFDALHAQGITLVLVTHEDDVAARAERVAHFRDGRIERWNERPKSAGKPGTS